MLAPGELLTRPTEPPTPAPGTATAPPAERPPDVPPAAASVAAAGDPDTLLMILLRAFGVIHT